MTATRAIGSEGLWQACDEMEVLATKVLLEQLAPFQSPIRKCYEAGVQAPTLPGKRHNEPDMLLAALFLKKALNDLRSVWKLLLYGYTSQAAAVAAALYENALAVNCLAGDSDNTLRFQSEKSGDLPWSPQELARVLARKWQARTQLDGKQVEQRDYEIYWRHTYAAYKWLCKIKHPTARSAIHDSQATVRPNGQYVVMAAPDLRPEDLQVKATILTMCLSRMHEAIRNFALMLDCDRDTEEYKSFSKRMAEILLEVKDAFSSYSDQALPFTIGDSSLAQEVAQLRAELQ